MNEGPYDIATSRSIPYWELIGCSRKLTSRRWMPRGWSILYLLRAGCAPKRTRAIAEASSFRPALSQSKAYQRLLPALTTVGD